MKVLPFNNCCNAAILVNLGSGEEVGETGVWDKYSIDSMSLYDIKAWLAGVERSYADEGFSLLVAITNDTQIRANNLLKDAGWKSTGWISKDKHPNTKVKLWYKILGEEESD